MRNAWANTVRRSIKFYLEINRSWTAPGVGCELMSHFWSGRVGTLRNQFESNQFMAMRALRADGRLIQNFHLVIFHPHQLEATGTTLDLRHGRSPSSIIIKSCNDGDYHNIRRQSLSRA